MMPFNWPYATFPIGTPLEPSLYLQPFSRYSAFKTRVHRHTDTHAASDSILCPMQWVTLTFDLAFS